MDYWSKTLGVGPWFYNPKVPIKNYLYRGERYEPHNSVALANSGFVQVELIQTPQRRAVDVPRLPAGRPHRAAARGLLDRQLRRRPGAAARSRASRP